MHSQVKFCFAIFFPGSFSLKFPKIGITDYASVTGMPSLQAITACFWMRSSDQKNKGTPLSYATSSSPRGNEFVVYNYRRFGIIVNDKHSGLAYYFEFNDYLFLLLVVVVVVL